MSKITQLIHQDILQVEAGIFDSIENSFLVTTDRLLIFEDKITLPRKSFGAIIWNMAIIFDDFSSNVIAAEATCSLDPDQITVNFDPADNLNMKYAVVSYLGKANE